MLREEERYLRTILRTTAEGFWEIDIDGKITKVNEAYCRMSGYTYEELMNLNISAIDAVDDQAAVLARIQRLIANGSEIFETRHRKKDGSVFHVKSR